MTGSDNPIRRVYVEKKAGFEDEARRLQGELVGFLENQYPELGSLRRIRILHRYDTAHLTEEQFALAVQTVFSEAQCDQVFWGAAVPAESDEQYFGVEYLPGQYDQRADSAEQCIELVADVKPAVRTATIYLLQAKPPLSDAAIEGLKRYLINPVDSRAASLDMPAALEEPAPQIQEVPVLRGFSQEPREFALHYGLAMSEADLRFCRSYFAAIRRDPTLAELRVLDTYWSDHCRHTTFTTALDSIDIAEGPLAPALRRSLALYEEARKQVYDGDHGTLRSLMDMATIAAKVLKKQGLLNDLDESQEINACTLKVTAEFHDGSQEPWLLLFKNETHNHPTEIEPFGGAATCLGGAIRDPLSGRAFVHQAMRITGGGDPRTPLSETLPGKLPQLKLAREAAGGYSSYGNQIGLATGQVAEFYHKGFTAKRMELGAVIAAAPENRVRREAPKTGDLVILLGGKTGRDGIGGATGSSKAHTGESVASSAAEVQKGNPVEERKLQRLFRNPEVTRLIKRCNDFGAGGVAVAVGELAPGVEVNLDAVPKKYAGLDGVELAISESQERMAAVVAPENAEALIRYADAENLDAVIIARITAGDEADTPSFSLVDPDKGPHLRMIWQGKTMVDLSRQCLNSNGAPRSGTAAVSATYTRVCPAEKPGITPAALLENLERELKSLRSCSRRGLQEQFDGSIGAGSVLFPWGGGTQGTPECGIATLLPALEKESRTASLMTFGYDPDLSSLHPYLGAQGAIREALAKFACLGGNPWKSRLSLQEYFARPETPESWGTPVAALLGALEAQLTLGIPAIGGKDSMSGTYRDMDRGIDMSVPPTLVAFAAGTAPAPSVRSGALSGEAGNPVILLYQPQEAADEWDGFKANLEALLGLAEAGLIRAAYPVGAGGIASSLAVMAFGNMTGLEVQSEALTLVNEQTYPGAVLVEIDNLRFSGEAEGPLDYAGGWKIAARTIPEPIFRIVPAGSEAAETRAVEFPLTLLRRAYESPLIQVYPQTARDIASRDTITVPGALRGSSVFAITTGYTKQDLHAVKQEAARMVQAAFAQVPKEEIIIADLPNGLICILPFSTETDRLEDALKTLRSSYPLMRVYPLPEEEPYDFSRFPCLAITTGYIGHDTQAVDQDLTRIVDSALDHIPGVEQKIAESSSGSSRILMRFTPGTDLAAVSQTLRDALEKLKPSLPRDAEVPSIFGSHSSLKKPGSFNIKVSLRPLTVLPVFPGTNCEWDLERAFRRAGGRTRTVVFRNRTPKAVAESIETLARAIQDAQIVALSGGFSAGDEPEGSGKFIANVFRSPRIMEAVTDLLEKRDGLMLGICNGFQALIKLGLVPYGAYRQADQTMPTLTFNALGRHVSRMVHTVVMPTRSPWLALEEAGAVHVIPVSHGEGRLVINGGEGLSLFRAGQVPFCYATPGGRIVYGEPENPNGSAFGIEGLLSPDGRILGKMGHSERCGEYVHVNIPGSKYQRIFEAGLGYFR